MADDPRVEPVLLAWIAAECGETDGPDFLEIDLIEVYRSRAEREARKFLAMFDEAQRFPLPPASRRDR